MDDVSITMTPPESQNLKKIVAESAVNHYVRDGMTVGLGTGSTAEYAIRKVGELAASGYELTCVATSLRTEKLAAEVGVRISDLSDVEHIDVTIDGADEVDPDLQLIKGLGGALLREKIVAAATVKEIIIVDDSKLVQKLGTRSPLPVEVVPFGHTKTKYALEKQGCKAALRTVGGRPFITDSGNYVYDCVFAAIESPFFLESRIDVIPGVVENGLFLNTAYAVLSVNGEGVVTAIGRDGTRDILTP
ncbi:MAG: ribose-5-phosphate isomerase RpiA [Candidatus Methanoplasma sp.]|jgi:ribose 5-phosphate isomerase A|nr:ribose-5-phosphate isomerase RpiA [Candidatus Methanoplasma sp.]